MKEELNKKLLEAAKNGDIEAFQGLLVEGADPRYRDPYGAGALLYAAGHGRIPMLEYLLKNNLAAMTERDNYGMSPLLNAAHGGHIPMLEYLLKNKLSQMSERANLGHSPLLIAVERGHVPMVEYLLKNKWSKMSERTNNGFSPLLVAVCQGHLPVVKYLVENKLAEASERNKDGDSPLLLAAYYGHVSIVEYLLKNKLLSMSERNNEGSFPLLWAARQAQIPVVRYLLQKGCFIDLLTNCGHTTHQFISRDFHAKVGALPLLFAAETLLKIAANPDGNSPWLLDALKILNEAVNARQISDGNTALHLAILHKNKALVRLLLDHAADISLINNDNRTPLQLALSSKDPYIRHRFNLIKLEALSKAPVAMEVDTDQETAKDSKEAKESKETKELKETKQAKELKEIKESKESQEQCIVPPEDLDKLIEVTFKGIQGISDQKEREELFYKLGTILCKADSPCFRPLLAYQIINTFTPQSLKQYQDAHYKAYELVMGGHVIISQSKDPFGDEPEVLPNTGLALPNDDIHRYLRLRTLLKHLHLANYQDTEGKVLSKLVAEFALGPAESMTGIPGLTGINGVSQFILVDLLQKARLKSEEQMKKLKAEALEKEQKLLAEKQSLFLEKEKLIDEKQKINEENEKLAAEIESLKSQLMDIDPDSFVPKSYKRKDNPSEQDNLAPGPKRRRLENSNDVSNGSEPILYQHGNIKGEEMLFSKDATDAHLALKTKLTV